MPYTPDEIEEVESLVRAAMLRWHRDDVTGEIVIVRGGNEWQVEERPIVRHRVKRQHRRVGYLEKVAGR